MALGMKIDLQCGSCSALVHQTEPAQKFCPCCGAAFERYCFACQKKVSMYFEEWWPEENECLRTYTPARRCPTCNSNLEGHAVQDSSKNDSSYNH